MTISGFISHFKMLDLAEIIYDMIQLWKTALTPTEREGLWHRGAPLQEGGKVTRTAAVWRVSICLTMQAGASTLSPSGAELVLLELQTRHRECVVLTWNGVLKRGERGCISLSENIYLGNFLFFLSRWAQVWMLKKQTKLHNHAWSCAWHADTH